MTDTQASEQTAAKKPTAVEKRKDKKPKSTGREGLITVIAIAKEYKLTPREARAILRAEKVKKPSGGWAYDPKDAALKRVREILKGEKK